MNKIKLLVVLLITISFGFANAQLNVRTLSTARSGRLPQLGNERYPSVYTDFTVEYRYNSWLGGLRAEGYSADDAGESYNRVSQFYLDYSWDWGSARAGNAYEILGRGIIYRGFELPGFVNDTRFPRTQHRVIRDVQGVNIKLNPGRFGFKFLAGQTPHDPLAAPDVRIDNDVIGGEFNVDLPFYANLGTAYVEYRFGRETSKLSTYFFSWSADNYLSKIGAQDLTFDFYTEYATSEGYGKPAELNQETPHALYLAGNFTWNSFGGSLEYKDYYGFNFGINDPPPLIRESSEYLLNRDTHTLDLLGETGYQLEFYYLLNPATRFTANVTRAEIHSGELFTQQYLGVDYLADAWSTRLFLEHGKEEFNSQPRRVTMGVAPDYTFRDGKVLGFDVQYQQIKADFLDTGYNIDNFYSNLNLKNWRNFSFAVSLERSTDPTETGVNPITEDAEKYFLNGSIGWTPTPRMSFQFFAGERRRAKKCDHGFCLDVPQFKGIEFRLDTSW